MSAHYAIRVSTNLTPADVMAQLGIHERRLRRFAAAYEVVFGALPRDRRGHRTFTPEAVERIAAALPVLIERPALGMEDVLRRQAGVVTSTPAAAPAPAPAPAAPAPELLEVLSALRADVAALRLEVAALRGERAARDAVAAPAAVEVQDGPHDTEPAQGADAPDEAPSRPSEGLDGVTILLVRDSVVPQRLKNDLRWSAKRYDELEALLADAGRLELRKTNGKETWRTPTGKTVRRDTVLRLYGVGVLGQVPDMTNSL